jgi:hypothetical protein
MVASGPLSATGVAVIRGQTGKHPTLVFSFRGKAVRQVNTKACAPRCDVVASTISGGTTCGTPWASWHVQAGTPLHVLQELGGWESVEMVREYAHLSTAHLHEYVDRVHGLTSLRVVV